MAKLSESQTYKRGMIGTGDRVANIHPEHWDPRIFQQLPVGRAPMTAMMMAIGMSSVSSRKTHWWQEPFQSMRGDVTDVYTNPGLSSAYASGGTSGQVLYVKMTAAHARQCIKNQVLAISNGSGGWISVLVQDVQIVDDTHTYVAVKLLEADSNDMLAGTSLKWLIAGNGQPEGSQLPESYISDPIEYENQTQIFMESLSFTGTELKERERVMPKVRSRSRTKTFMRFRNQIEWAIIFSILHTTTGANGKPQRFMKGLRQAISSEVSTNLKNYTTDSDYDGQTWLEGGQNWLEDTMEDLSRYSTGPVKKCYCGDRAWKGIKRLAEEYGYYEITPTTDRFGIRVNRMTGLNTDLDFIQHPLFTDHPHLRNSAVVIEPNLLELQYMEGRNIQIVNAREVDTDGWTWVDGTREGWFAELTLRWDNVEAMAWLDGIGDDNPAS